MTDEEIAVANGLWLALRQGIAAEVIGWLTPDRWQVRYSMTSEAPDEPPPDGFEPMGPWQPFASDSNGRDWRRPLRKVSP